MKIEKELRLALVMGVSLTFLLQLGSASYAQENDVFGLYSSRDWVEYSLISPACDWLQDWPDSGLVNRTYFSGDLPGLGYPFHKSIISGVNDTLNVAVTFVNSRVTQPYNLSGKDVGTWFEPTVYQLFVTDSGGPVFRDVTDLGFRLRGWYKGLGPISTPTSIPAGSARYFITFDIWDLPLGRYQICLSPTDNAPADFFGMSGGYVFEFYKAQSLADTVNAYEACFLRMEWDANFSAADLWADSILMVHSKSVPGWALKARSSLALKDTVKAKSSYDNAIDYLNNDGDFLMPDSTERPLTPAEKNYIRWLKVMLARNREALGP